MTQWLLVIIGCGTIVGCVALLQNRERVFEFIADGQEALFGRRLAARTRKSATPMTGVGVPAIGGMVIGLGFILGGLFGEGRM